MSGTIETPSGKDAGSENFPVGSFLLPKPLRPHVACFYRFARAADDIADNPDLTEQEKLDRLEAFDRALVKGSTDPEFSKPDRLRDSLLETGVTNTHARDLLRAFMQDSMKTRYDTWDDLMAYCRLSASPVGRYLLDLHGEDPAKYVMSDRLCDTLQVINHLQDCQDDYREMNRVYIPMDWLDAQGIGVEVLDAPRQCGELRTVIDQCLAECRQMMEMAELLPQALTNRRLGAESAVIVSLANQLIGALEWRDPLATRVKFGKMRMAWIAFCALNRFIDLRWRRPYA